MSETTVLEDRVETIPVLINGRRRSPPVDPGLQPPRERTTTINTRREEDDLPAALGQVIWEQLAWNALPLEEPDRRVVVETYTRSLEQLQDFRREADNLVRYACLANLEFRQAKGETHAAARDIALKQELDEMLAKAAAPWLPVRNVLDEKVVSQPISALRSQLANALTEAVAEFAEQFFELLAQLFQQELIGIIEWQPHHCCGYHFFKRVVIQENEGVSQRVLDTQFWGRDDSDSDTGRRVVGKRTIEETTQGTHYFHYARHKHVVMGAIHTTIGNSRVVMPPPVVRLTEQIPKWLYPLVQVIDGDICREHIVEQTVKAKTWADTRVRDEPVYGCEPAVIIGQYVLTGWGPREVGEEQARRLHIQENIDNRSLQRIAGYRAVAFAVAAVALAFVATGLWVQFFAGWASAPIAVLATATAIGLIWQAAFDFTVSYLKHPSALAAHWLTAALGCDLLLIEWIVARWFQPMSWVTPVAILLGAVWCHSVSHRYWQTEYSQ